MKWGAKNVAETRQNTEVTKTAEGKHKKCAERKREMVRQKVENI